MKPRIYYSKFTEVGRLLAPESRSLLDVGCRDGRLRRHLPSHIEYAGIDLTPGPAVTKVCNIEKGIPFPDASFDTVVALDVLEHTDNIWFSFAELARVASRQVMVVLPNSYHWRERLRFLRGKEGDKHKLPVHPIEDRHRWLPSYSTACAFSYAQAERLGLPRPGVSMMVDERPNLPREWAARVFSPNLMSVNVFFLFNKAPGPAQAPNNPSRKLS